MRGIGVDIVDLDRLNLENTHFIKRILTPKEYDIFIQLNSQQRQREFLGGRFAGKEAYLKAYFLFLAAIAATPAAAITAAIAAAEALPVAVAVVAAVSAAGASSVVTAVSSAAPA